MHVRWLDAREAHEALRSGKVSLVVSAGPSRKLPSMTRRGRESRIARGAGGR